MGTRRDWNRLDSWCKEAAKEVDSKPKAQPKPSGIDFSYPQEVKPSALFAAKMAGGLSYCDTRKEVKGDYKVIAFAPWSTLLLEVYHPKSDLLPEILIHFEKVKADGKA
jgi:hypothetical protein